MFAKKLAVVGGVTLALLVTAAPTFAQWGPGERGPGWDRRGRYYTYSPYTSSADLPVVDSATYYSSAAPSRSVLIQMKVPETARVWFENAATTQTGADRQFISPPLTQGANYVYQVRVQWNDNGQMKDQTRNVTVRAGDRITLEFGEKQQ